ncbi:MAG: tetratricopeptide repeat protein [Bacteroides sp.]|nr:tetratricopeptide repeat protein [Bacteroides sp.]
MSALFMAASEGTSEEHSTATLRTLDSISGVGTARLVEDGERMFSQGDYDSALNIFTVVCRRYDESAGKDMQKIFANAYNRYGNILYKRGAYSLAMDSYLKMRQIAEGHGLGDELAVAYVRIGNIYAASGDYTSAADFYKRALEVPEIKNNPGDAYQLALNNLFAASLLAGNIEESRKYLDLYRKEFGSGKISGRIEFDILLAEGLLAMESGRTRKALDEYNAALVSAMIYDLDPLCEGSVYSCMGNAYKSLGKSDSAIYCLRKAADIAATAGNGRLLVESLRDIADFYEHRRMPDSANFYKASYLNLADSISYQEEVNKLKSSQMLYELDKSEFTIRNLSAQKQTQSAIIIVIAVAAVICIVLVIILLIQNKKLRAAWVDLYERSSQQLNGDNTLVKVETAEDMPEERKLVIDADTRNKIADAILNYMENSDGYCSSDFSLERLAGEIGYNPRYVSEVINVEFNKNFRALLNEYRVRKAMIRLQDTENYGNYTIKAISESVGYKSQATFISVFTKITGLKPGIYQKLARERNGK